MTVARDLAKRVKAAPARLGAVRLVCIDGPAGSGKTTLAAALVAELTRCDVAVIHMDDVYEGWDGLEEGFGRLDPQVLTPLAAGGAGSYRRYDWERAELAERVDVPVPEILVVEGCGSAPRALGDRATLTVFVEAPPALRLARGLERDGESFRPRWLRWMDQEALHFARERTRERADVVVDGVDGSLTDARGVGGASGAGAGGLRELLAGRVLDVAPRLLGARVTSVLDEGTVTVRITEVEAYDGQQDPGSHAYRGRTERNAVMFGPPGRLYVYRHLGLHHCANVVTGPDGRASAVLLRAGEVVEGAGLARERRERRGVARTDVDLARGPARLAQALGLDLTLYGADVLDPRGPVRLEPGDRVTQYRTGPRVGVGGPGGDGQAYPWRFWVPDEPTVSPFRAAAPSGRRTRRRAGSPEASSD